MHMLIEDMAGYYRAKPI